MKKNYFALTVFIVAIAFSTQAQLDYKDVAHIFYKHCTSCHHENQHAPSFVNYSAVNNYTYSIQTKLQDGSMPPWSPDTSYSSFAHERTISQAEKDSILNWINGGAIAGDTTLAGSAPTYAQYQLYGTPDLVLQIPTFTSNAVNSDSYVCFSLPSGLTQNKVLRAFEIIPGNPEIVHHVIVNADTMATTSNDLSGSCFNPPGDFGIGGYAPGAPPTVFPGQFPFKAGIAIKAGSKILLQMHYPAGSAGLVDSTQIRMYFYPDNETGIRPIHVTTPLQNWTMSIAPNTTASYTDMYPNNSTLPMDLSLFATFPHSHKLCTTIINYAFAGTDTIPLVKINTWDFNWQGFYTYKNLVKIPTGYKLFSKHEFDNTANNPNNPHNPPVLVTAGTSTNDEMFFDGYMWLTYQPGDEFINLDSMLQNDPLLTGNSTVGINQFDVMSLDAYVYPNPATNRLTIQMSKKSEYKVTIFNVAGQRMLETPTFIDNTVVETKNIPAGVYFVDITDTLQHHKITKKIIINNN